MSSFFQPVSWVTVPVDQQTTYSYLVRADILLVVLVEEYLTYLLENWEREYFDLINEGLAMKVQIWHS